MAIDGVSGAGKTFTALRFAFALGKRVAVINSESGAVEKYLGLSPDGTPFQFDVCELDDFAPTKYTEAILAAGAAGYDVIVIDSLSHAWAGAGGALELKDRQGGNSFTAWKNITPIHNQMIEAILRSPAHMIATMRSKTEYILETDSRGRSVPRKVGMSPIQRSGMEYEFDAYCSLDSEHILTVTKSRIPEIDNKMSVKPGASFMEPVTSWLNDGSDASPEQFAVTEEDLKKFERRIEADKPAEPAKTPQQLMEEAAARAEAKATGVATEEVAEPPVNSDPVTSELATSKQVDQIIGLFDSLGAAPETRKQVVAKRGVDSIDSLSRTQAEEIIHGLKGAVLAATTAGGGNDVGQMRIHENDPCTESQVAEIKKALTQWETDKPGVSADFVSRLNGAGFSKIAELTYSQATSLLADIEAKQMENFFAFQLETAAAG
jgi:hypothetical protein